MKKSKLIGLLALVAFASPLLGCGNNKPLKENNDQNVPGGDNVNPGPEVVELTYADIDRVLARSKPTKVNTHIFYQIPDPLDVTLNFSSTLNIEYGSLTIAEYIYTYQKLNPIGSESMISTNSGICYSKGNMIGEFDGKDIEWNLGIESDLALLGIHFGSNQSIFETSSIENNKFTGKLKDSELKTFGFSKDITNVNVEVGLDQSQQKVGFINVTYKEKTSEVSSNSPAANVIINTNYNYDRIHVDIPENIK